MSIREDISQYLQDYRGVLGWNSYTEVYTNTTIPHIEIPLYVKEASVPIRKPKTTELSTVQTTDPGTRADTTTNVIFFGAPDVLQTTLSGWTITPVSNTQWAPVDVNGNPLNWGQLSYNDIIGYFIEGRFNRNVRGAWQRKDPDYYTTPRGHQYINPIIAAWQPQAQPVQRKQAFDMTLFLEA